LSKTTKVILVVLLVLIIDQSLKIWIKTSMALNEDIPILGMEWARLHFVENPGMAFGWKLPEPYGKLLLSLFRIFAVSILIYFIRQLIQAKAKPGLLISFGLILAGAIGNIIDSAFYGLIFSDSFHGVATMFPEGNGYAGFLHGKVVDMFYFPMFKGNFPEWFPFWSGERFLFFRPVFNIADASITVGVLCIITFHRSFFGSKEGTLTSEQEEEEPVVSPESNADISTIDVDDVQKNNGDIL
jgi:signal peptidase II